MTLNDLTISKEKFLEVYNSYPPNKFTKFIFKYFSKSTTKKDSWLSRLLKVIFLVLFLTGFVGTIVKAPRNFIGTVTIIFALLLVIVVGSLGIAVIINNLRIRKIRKKLGLRIQEYNDLANQYLS